MANVDDATRMRHMLEYAEMAVRLSSSRSRRDLDTDELFPLAMVRAVEVVGEAAARVSAQGRSQYPQLPWPLIVGMRNRLIHGYDEVDLNILWETLVHELPELIATLKRILPPVPGP